MAKSSSWRSRLTALGSVLASATLALANPSGPFQPFTVIVGWAAVAALVIAVLGGFPRLVAMAACLHVIRVGVAGMAGDLVLSPALWALLIYVMVDLASSSFSEREGVVGWRIVVARVVGGGAFAYVSVSLGGVAAGRTPLVGDLWPLVGLVAAFGIAGILSHLTGRAIERQDSPVQARPGAQSR